MFITLLLDVDSVVDCHTISHAFSHISECSVQHRHIPPKSNDYPLLVNCRVKLTGTPSHTTHVSIWVRYFGAKQISPTLAYVERIDLSHGFFPTLANIDFWLAWLSREKAMRHEEKGGYMPECDYLTNSCRLVL